MWTVRRSTFGALVAPNESALRGARLVPCAAAMPIAIRHAASSAVIAIVSDSPTTSVAIPAGVVTKNQKMSVSATTLAGRCPSATNVAAETRPA